MNWIQRATRTPAHRFAVATVVTTLIFALAHPYDALAVHDTGAFQLDGNAQTSLQSTPPAAEDWDKICPASSPPSRPSTDPVHCLGGTTADNSVFAVDPFNSNLDDSFTSGGSKDDLDIPSWKWVSAAASPDKDDLEHGYAAEYTVNTATYPNSKVLFFGADRFTNSGDANIAFWFMQAGVAEVPNAGNTCTIASGCPFSGVHTPGNKSLGGNIPGDILIVSAFTGGGAQPTIHVYEWVGTGNATKPCFTNACSLQPIPIPIPSGQTDNRCDSTTQTGDEACALVNTGPIDSPWFFTEKSKSAPANKFQANEFYEGGLNLTGLGFGGTCFRSFLINTRSSQSGDATLHDLVLGSFGQCFSEIQTTPKDGNGGDISGPLSIGTGSVSVKDSATINVTGVATWSGTLKFFLCGPLTVGTCTSGAAGETQIGTTLNVNQNTAQPILSAAATVTSVGRYCWRGEFKSSTTGVPDGSDSSAGECFEVTPVTPALSTSASGGGNIPATITDTALLTGTANKPGSPVINPASQAPANGTITFTVYGPNDTTCATPSAFATPNTATATVSGDGSYSVSVTVSKVGTYTFVASYSGDSPNTLGTGPTSCGDLNEKVTATDTSSLVSAQTWVPNDSATVSSGSGNTPLNGTLTIALYESSDCSGTAVGGQTYTKTMTNATSATDRTLTTSNSTYTVSASKSVSWLVTFSSTDPNVSSPSSHCETSSLTITN